MGARSHGSAMDQNERQHRGPSPVRATRQGKRVAPSKARTKQVKAARDGGPDRLKGMARSFAVLDYLASSPGRIVDVTRGLDLPWATVHRTIIQLEKAQFLRRDPETHRYEIGPRLWYVGSAYLANHRVLKAAMPYLNQSQDNEGVAVQIVERIGFQSVAVYSAQRLTEDITKAHYGYHFPLHCGSKGQVLLAYEEPAFIEAYLARDLERLTSETITDPHVLRARLAEIREAGFALTVADVQPFTGSMAAPIRDASGRVATALCYVFRKALARNNARREELQDHLIHTAHSISIDLGWRPGQP
jgi:DNA-binding IclR family transcriptional regulator